MRIGYISPVNPFKDKKAWSGTYHSVYKALENSGQTVEWVSYNASSILIKLAFKLYNFLNHDKGNARHSKLVGWLEAHLIKDNLDKYDLIFIPGQSELVGYLTTKTPIVYYSDATVPLMVNYYWFNFSKKTVREAEIVEKQALDKSSIKLFCSHWAANSAIDFYNQDEKYVKVFPLGANIPDQMIKSNYKFKKKNTLNIFFSGVDWKRKGGDIAVKTVKELIRDGYKAKLTICGISDDISNNINEKFINNVGYLDKNNPSDLVKYISLWKKADLFLLPTRAECAGIVFNEASAFGVPVLTTDTGGISDYVENNVNGYRMKLTANERDYASKIEYFIDNNLLSIMSNNALKRYKKQNNWDTWGIQFNSVVNHFLEDNVND